MSEEEIIEYFKEVISWHRKNTPDRVYALNNKDIEMIQGLLDLYNKEKEKNKKLIDGQIETIEKILAPKLLEKFISKDKIKEKIEELGKKEKEELKGTKGQDRYNIKQEFMFKKNILQELLEERK